MFYLYLNLPPILTGNIEKQTHDNTHSKTQFKRSPSPMSESVTKETKQNGNDT